MAQVKLVVEGEEDSLGKRRTTLDWQDESQGKNKTGDAGALKSRAKLYGHE